MKKIFRLGRVSKLTRGAVIPNRVEDQIMQTPGSLFPKMG